MPAMGNAVSVRTFGGIAEVLLKRRSRHGRDVIGKGGQLRPALSRRTVRAVPGCLSSRHRVGGSAGVPRRDVGSCGDPAMRQLCDSLPRYRDLYGLDDTFRSVTSALRVHTTHNMYYRTYH